MAIFQTVLLTLAPLLASAAEDAPFPFALTPGEVREAACIDAASVSETVRALSAIPSRVPGYGGTGKAARYVHERFEAAGLTGIQGLPFTVTAPVQRRAELAGDGFAIPLDAFWPNLVRTCTTPRRGIAGRLVYGKSGTLADLAGKPVEGAIVALDYNCGRNWLNVCGLGGKAVLFIAPDATTHYESASKFLRTPVNVPRFYLARERWDALRGHLGEEVTLHAGVLWEDTTETNIVGWVRGTGVEPDEYGRVLADEVIVLSAYYDSMSVVPSLAPGAQQACGIAGLIDAAAFFASHPPPRSILFLATSAHGLFMQGMAEFCDHQLEELRVKPGTIIALDLASSGDKVGAYNRGHAYWDCLLSGHLFKLYEPIGTQLNLVAHRTALLTGVYSEEEYRARGMDRSPLMSPFVETLTGNALGRSGTDWGYTLPTGQVHEAETGMLFGHLAYAFVTWGSEHPLIDSPLDTFAHYREDSLIRQLGFIRPVLREMLHSRDPVLGFITRIEQIVDWNRQAHRAKFFPPNGTNAGVVSGRVVEFVPKKNYIPDEPKDEALAVVRRESGNTYLGVRCEPVQRVRTVEDEGRSVRACFRFPNVGRGVTGEFSARGREIEAYVLDPESGDICYAKDLGRNGELAYPTVVYGQTTPQEVRRTVVVFPCHAVDLFDLFDPRYLRILESIRILDGQTDSDPESYGFAAARVDGGGGTAPGAFSYYDPCAALFVHRKEHRSRIFKVLGAAGIFGQRLALLNASEADTTGAGFDAMDGPIYNTALHAARDMYLLNGGRISELARTGILTVSLDDTAAPAESTALVVDLHRESGVLLEQAENALARHDYPAYTHTARSSWALASRAYPLVLRAGNDAVLTVLLYLALLLPAAFFLEKLLFGFPDIKRQLLGRAGIFCAVFLLLRLVNPAFDLTVNPYVVLLGFVMIALTLAVLRVIMKMFQDELKRLREQATGIHNVEIGRSDAAGVAFGLGISSMRKRRLRTANTLVTLVILTFSILSFTSVVSRNDLKGRDLYDQSLNRITASYTGVLFRSPTCDPIIQDAYDHLLSEFAGATIIAPRAWFPGGTAPMNSMTRLESVTGQTASIPSLLGLTPQEKDIAVTNPDWLQGSWFTEEDRHAILLAESLAKLAGLGPEHIGQEAVTILGRTFVLRGILSDDFFDRRTGFLDIDGEPLSPVNYAMSASTYQEARATRPDIVAQKPPPTLSHFDGLGTAIVPFDTAIEMGGNIRSIAIVSRDPRAVSEQTLRDEVLNKLATGLFAGIDGKSYWFTSLGHADYKGLFSLIVLICIGGLIIFNTILGSLYERQREIGIYTSLGLAPSHIGAFFLAESCVYAVLGALFGYILGQVVAQGQVMLDLSVLRGLTLNYSSKSAIYATFIVSGVVMLSSLYPAWKAGRLSVPELERGVQLPEPVDDTMRLEFPFTFSAGSAGGVMAFLFRYFKEQEELATGLFHSQATRICQQGDHVHIDAEVWLAPFDWGISQYMHIETASEAGNLILAVSLKRVNGEVRAWQRVNRRFVAHLRRQLLLWRTITPADRDRYMRYGARLLEGRTGAVLEAAPVPEEALS